MADAKAKEPPSRDIVGNLSIPREQANAEPSKGTKATGELLKIRGVCPHCSGYCVNLPPGAVPRCCTGDCKV